MSETSPEPKHIETLIPGSEATPAEMLTVKEVAERLRVSRTCVYQLIERGMLVCHRIGLGRGAIRIAQFNARWIARHALCLLPDDQVLKESIQRCKWKGLSCSTFKPRGMKSKNC